MARPGPISLPAVVALAVLNAAFGHADAHTPAGGGLLIVHADDLGEAAGAWSEYRSARGWRVVTHAVAGGGDTPSKRADLAARIRRFAAEQPDGSSRAVLLLGDADTGGIPTWHVAQKDPTLRPAGDAVYATDHPYQLLADGDLAPAIALGRVPARTPDEALSVLAKIKRYEGNDRPGPWRRRVAYTAGEGGFGLADHLLESLFRALVDRYVPPAFDISMTYAKPTSIYCPPPSRLTDTVLGQLGDGALLFNYVGHGTATAFDRLNWNGSAVPILEVADLDRLQGEPGVLPIALLTCCSAGWYDLPDGGVSLGEAMLFHPAGPVAVIAGSRPTHPYANVILQKEITRLLLIDRVATAGELDLRAMQQMLAVDEDDRQLDALAAPIALAMSWPSSLRGLRRMHTRLYNLLGDPALEIAVPRDGITDLTIADSRVSGHVKEMRAGRVLLTFESTRSLPADRRRLVTVLGADDPDLEVKAAHNYPIANDVVFRRIEANVVRGRFSAAIDGGLPAGVTVIKAYAAGTDDRGETMDALGALRVGGDTSTPNARSGSGSP